MGQAEKRNQAEALIFQAERQLLQVAFDFGVQFAPDRRRRIEGLVQELRNHLEQGDELGIDTAQAKLQDELYDFYNFLYDLNGKATDECLEKETLERMGQAEKRNQAEALTFQAERLLREVAIDFGMQFARDRRRRIEGLVQELRDYLEQSDERGIDIAQTELQDELYDLNREAYLEGGV